MDYNELARNIISGCEPDIIVSKDDAIEAIENACYTLEENNNFKTIASYLDIYFENSKIIHEKIKDDLLKMLDHECEVFDPICDGPVEHAEGMAMAREFIEKYFREKLGG